MLLGLAGVRNPVSEIGEFVSLQNIIIPVVGSAKKHNHISSLLILSEVSHLENR
jgi:hypothetical protein